MGPWALMAVFLILEKFITGVTSQTITDFFIQTRNHEIASRPQSANRMRMSESCLGCLCAASTGCQLTTRCVSGGQYCGPFLISKPYWLDAGSPVLLGDSAEREEAFSDCAMDPICSAQTVRKYMTRFQKDCNGSGDIDCEDLARIHLMGPFGTECSKSSLVEATGFYQKFQQCWNSVLRVSSSPSQTI